MMCTAPRKISIVDVIGYERLKAFTSYVYKVQIRTRFAQLVKDVQGGTSMKSWCRRIETQKHKINDLDWVIINTEANHGFPRSLPKRQHHVWNRHNVLVSSIKQIFWRVSKMQHISRTRGITRQLRAPIFLTPDSSCHLSAKIPILYQHYHYQSQLIDLYVVPSSWQGWKTISFKSPENDQPRGALFGTTFEYRRTA